MKKKNEKKFWFLHFAYVDMYGMQHNMKLNIYPLRRNNLNIYELNNN